MTDKEFFGDDIKPLIQIAYNHLCRKKKLISSEIFHVYSIVDDVLIQKGERFGAADVYFAIHGMEEIQDYICVGQKKWNGDSRAVLFVKMRNGYAFNPEFKNKIANKIKKELWEDCVPELILEVQDIPAKFFPCELLSGFDRGVV
ncbi:UNVERIFIED_CONTAM: Acetoacetyl-CoA synthetase [Trichonephila clavipes]